MDAGKTRVIILIIFLALGLGLFWLSAKFSSKNKESLSYSSKDYLLRNSHHYSLFNPQEISQLESSLRPEGESSEEDKGIALSDLRVRGVPRQGRLPFRGAYQREWWGVRKLRPQSDNVKLNVRPNDEFLEELWLNDMNVQKSFERLDLQRPPIKGEIVIPY